MAQHNQMNRRHDDSEDHISGIPSRNVYYPDKPYIGEPAGIGTRLLHGRVPRRRYAAIRPQASSGGHA